MCEGVQDPVRFCSYRVPRGARGPLGGAGGGSILGGSGGLAPGAAGATPANSYFLNPFGHQVPQASPFGNGLLQEIKEEMKGLKLELLDKLELGRMAFF